MWNISVHRSQMKERRTSRCSKHFSQNLDTQKWSNNLVVSSMIFLTQEHLDHVFLFKLQSAFFPDRQQNSWKKVQSENACWNFPKCRTEALPELDLFLLFPGSKWPGMVVEKRQVADPLKFSWESNPCKVYVWDRNSSFIQAAGPPKQ